MLVTNRAEPTPPLEEQVLENPVTPVPRGGRVVTTQGEAISGSPKASIGCCCWNDGSRAGFGIQIWTPRRGWGSPGRDSCCLLSMVALSDQTQLLYFTPRRGDVPRTWCDWHRMSLPTAFSLPSKPHCTGASTRSRNTRAEQ